MFSYRVLTVTAVAPGNSPAGHEPMAVAVRAEGNDCCIAASCLEDDGQTCAGGESCIGSGDSCVFPSCPAGVSHASVCDMGSSQCDDGTSQCDGGTSQCDGGTSQCDGGTSVCGAGATDCGDSGQCGDSGGECGLGLSDCGLGESLCEVDSCQMDSECLNSIPIKVDARHERARGTGAPTLSALREQLALALSVAG